jgi:hypothetical protein
VQGSLQPGLAARPEYFVPAERTVPRLLPESDEFAAMPDVLEGQRSTVALGLDLIELPVVHVEHQ